MKRFMVCLIMVAMLLSCTQLLAYDVPAQYSKVKYFYVFGTDGEPLYGAEDSELVLHIDVPKTEESQVLLSVYDPDVGGKLDWRTYPENPWDTISEFSVSGASTLDTRKFQPGEYDRKYYTFGPYSKDQGEDVGDAFRFTLTAKGLQGDDANLFKVRISPDSARAFSMNITFRLLREKGATMHFYPEIPAGTNAIMVDNYDLDKDGGTSVLYDDTPRVFWNNQERTMYDIKDSRSGIWEETAIDLDPVEASRRFEYVVTKSIQPYAHAGLRVKDSKGNPLPIYFREAPPAVTVARRPAPRRESAPRIKETVPPERCNTFIFDGTESYSITGKDLSYHWDFGDGSESDQPVVEHTFGKPGSYKVKLTVINIDSDLPCNKSTMSRIVDVNIPPRPDFTVADTICEGETITLDASATESLTPDDLNFVWYFDDETTAEGIKTDKKFQTGGRHDVTLTVDDNSGMSDCSRASMTKSIFVNSAPTAVAGKDIAKCLNDYSKEYRMTFDAGRSGDADRDRLLYTWDFGDGTVGEGKRVEHIFQESGTYTVNLEVDDGRETACSTSTDSIEVILSRRPQANAGDDATICTDEKLTFNASDTVVEEPEMVTYKWDFGDGNTAEGLIVKHTYREPGKYKVTLLVDDNKEGLGSTDTDTKNVYVSSVPVFSLENPDFSCSGDKVRFKAVEPKGALSRRLVYHWDFGDGTRMKGSSSVSHSYSKGGEYVVTVIADDGMETGCSQAQEQGRILVNSSPIVHPGPNLVCCQDEVTKFDGTRSYDPDGNDLLYAWDFGDGTTSSGAKVTHIYRQPGRYKVSLKVDDGLASECSTSTSGFIATVDAPPVADIKVR